MSLKTSDYYTRDIGTWGGKGAVIAQATLNKIHRQRIPQLREIIGDSSKGRTGEGFDKLP